MVHYFALCLKTEVYYMWSMLSLLSCIHFVIFLCTNWPKFGYELTGYLKLHVNVQFQQEEISPLQYT